MEATEVSVTRCSYCELLATDPTDCASSLPFTHQHTTSKFYMDFTLPRLRISIRSSANGCSYVAPPTRNALSEGLRFVPDPQRSPKTPEDAPFYISFSMFHDFLTPDCRVLWTTVLHLCSCCNRRAINTQTMMMMVMMIAHEVYKRFAL